MIILSQKQSNNINLLKGVSILLVLFGSRHCGRRSRCGARRDNLILTTNQH